MNLRSAIVEMNRALGRQREHRVAQAGSRLLRDWGGNSHTSSRDVPALAATLRRLIEQPALYADLARRGRARVLERYTQAALARQYYEVYREMLAA